MKTLNQTYDYDSIMHYGPFDFAKNRNFPTIIPHQKGAKIGQRRGLSERDVIKINLLYDCNRESKNLYRNWWNEHITLLFISVSGMIKALGIEMKCLLYLCFIIEEQSEQLFLGERLRKGWYRKKMNFDFLRLFLIILYWKQINSVFII